MLVHAIVDYSFLYYKYKFQLDSGKMKRLTAAVNWKGAVVEKDVSQIYYSIKEIEGFRRSLEKAGHGVFMSICFDMPSMRKESDSSAAGGYKSNRVKRLNDEDFDNIQYVEKLLFDAGHSTNRIQGYEADDIIGYLSRRYCDAFDYTVIYTPDLDLLVNIAPKVGVMRYKTGAGYQSVAMSNFSEYVGAELKCNMPYNGLMLYKATVGDKSDNIPGIHKFGPKAFDKLVDTLSAGGVDWTNMTDWRYVETMLSSLGKVGYFTEEQTSEALDSLSMVRPMEFDTLNGNHIIPAAPIRHSTPELREESYMRCNMRSLIE